MSALDKQVGGTHYREGSIQPIQYIESNKLTFSEGSVVKYITRHRNKNGIQDLLKIIHYVELILEMEYSAKADGTPIETNPEWEPVETQPLHNLSGTAGLYPHAKNLCQSKNCEPIQETIGKQLAAEVRACKSRIADEQGLKLIQKQIEDAFGQHHHMGIDKK